MGSIFNEMLNPDGSVRAPYAQIHDWVGSLGTAHVERALKEAEGIFRRLGFNAVFYAEVLSGSRMPNLMYMTTFRDQADRDARWKSFSADPDWKKLSAMEEYKNNVSKADKFFLRPVEYSDL